MAEDISLGSNTFQCSGCGAALKYKPGTTSLHCDYCGADTEIDVQAVDEVVELDFKEYAHDLEEFNIKATKVVSCRKCGAESTFGENMKSMDCPYCSQPLIEEDIHEERLIQPSYLLPFGFSDDEVNGHLSSWLRKRWFAPNKLKKRALCSDKVQGVYFPCWTYDANTTTSYTGERGTNYTVTVGSGKNRRTVVRTRWTYCSGRVKLFFDDVMVPASNMIQSTVLKKIENWDMKNLVEADNRFLSGFITEKYVLNLQQGFDRAKAIMAPEIDRAIRRDIGGDHQRISSQNTTYIGVKFKLILLPVYMSSYTYKNKLYHFFVNGRTGRITGDRPYSVIKIVSAIVCGLAAIAAIWIWLQENGYLN
ncbi:hypothetical protein D0T57_08925 [Dysgonomonas sp. 511]|nr:hypothetical protein [Dysgonomonas sp. 511]